MRTNVLNDLSNVVKKGTSLACSWSQVGRMSEGAPDEHPMSIRSASDGERWKPAGEKGSTRVWKHVAMIFAVITLSIANIGTAWGADHLYFWFSKAGDATTNSVTNNEDSFFGSTPSGSSSASGSVTIDGTTYTITQRSSNSRPSITFTIPANKTGKLYAIVQGSSSRSVQLKQGGTLIQSITWENSVASHDFDEVEAGTYTITSSGNVGWGMLAVKVSDAASTKRIYMKAGEWNNDSPYFYAHSWGSSNSDVLMTLADCETDVYYADIPSGNTSVLFTRQSTNSGIKYKDQDGNWNQSADITISTNNKFTFSAWNGGDGKSTFTGGTYSAPTYTISFAANGGSGSMSSISSIACGDDQALPANTFTKSGYVFDGWKADVAVTIGGSSVAAGTKFAGGSTLQNITSNITLTAQWEENSCPESGTVYSASTNATGNISIAAGASNLALNTATHKTTVTGGAMSVYNGQGSDKNLITSSGYCMTNNDTYFRIDLDCPLQEGDVISIDVGKDGSNVRGVWVTTATSRPGSAPACALTAQNASLTPVTYTVTGSDIYHGNSTFYIYRATANTTYFNNINITRTSSCGATQPGEIGKGSLSNCSITLTAANSPAANNTWYWQSASDGTATNLGSGATKSVSTPGTYYIRSYFSTGSCWSDARSVTVTEGDLTPAAPTSLTAASTTAKGTTFTVTGAGTSNFEFYVSTESTAPVAGTGATYSAASTTKTIDDKVAGTTYYAWVRAVCGSYKSAWTALTGNTFTTSTVSADYHLSNVTKTSGATSGIGGSTFTAVFAAVSGYSLPSPVVTIGGNSATSGTDYTWTAGTGTLTINANKINGDIDITMSSPASAPTNVAISGAYHYYPGETISLTATATGGNGPKTYQWYHGGTADGNAISGATSATYTKATCVVGDAGSYYCKVTCGGSASRWSDGATPQTPFNVKIMQFVLKNASGVTQSTTPLTKVDATHATVILHLTGGTTYKFRITDGCGNYFGNTGTMTNGNSTDWYMNADADCGMTTGLKTSNYTFNVTLSDLGNGMQVTAIYPGGDQAAGKIIYWDNSVLNWADGAQWYRIGKSTHHNKIQMTKVSGTANLYKVTTIEYNGFEYWHIANNQGNGDGNLFWTKGDAAKAITNAMEFEGAPVTLDVVTVTPTTSHATGETSDNDNCQFYTHTTVSGMKRDRVTITAPVNGTITVNYTSEENVPSSFSATTVDMYQDLAHTVILTSITAVPNTGYDAGAITINGGAYSANYVVTGATTIAATFSPHVYSITYLDQGGSAFSGSHVDSPNAHPTSHTYNTATTLNSATKTGYTFGGWFTNSACTGEAVASLGATAFSADITLYAKWTVNNYNLTWNLGGGTTTSAGTGIASGVSSNTTSSVAYGTSLTAPTVTKTGYNFSAWSPAVASTMPAEATTYTATWTLKTTTITINANTANHGSTTPGTVTATWGSALPSFTAASGESGYSLTGYYTDATSGTKIINADGTLVASTSYADGSGHWNSEAATLTLYAQYEEECTPQTISKVVLTAVDAGTVSGYNENEYAGAAVIGGLKSTNTAEVDASHAGVETGYKLNDNGKGIVFATLAKGTFQVGDVIKVTITYPNDNHTFAAPVSSKEALELFYGTNKDDATSLTILTGVSAAGTYSYTLTAADVTAIGSKKGIGVFRHSDRKQNPFVYSVEIYGCRDWVIEEEGLVNWTMNLNTNTWGTSSTSTTDETNISSISTSANTTDGTREGTTKKINLASAADNVNNAASFTFSLNSAKKIEPEKVTCKVFNVGDDEGLNYKAQLSDDNGHVYYSTNTVIPNTEATLTDAVFNFASDLILTGDITVKVYCWKSSGSGSAFRMGPKIRFFGEVESAADYTVTHTLSNVTKSAGATSVKEGNNYTATYAGAGGYTLPSTITVTIGGSPATAGTDYTWTQGTGVVSIPGNKVTGNIVITVTGVAPAPTYSVTHSLTNVTATSGATGAGAATEGVAYNAVFAANTGYVLPSTITVTIDGSPATVGTGYTWNASTGAFQVPAAQVTGAIVITIAGETAPATKDIYYGAITITAGALTKGSTGTSQFFTNIGGTIANNTEISWSSGPGTGGEYYESNVLTDTELSKSSNWNTSSGSNRYVGGMKFQSGSTYTLALGSKVASSITFYGRNGSASKTMTVGGEDWTSSATKNTFAKHEFIKTGGFTGNVSITQDGDFYGILVITIQTATPCTTPVIPALSNQTVCPGSDIAAWNATQTAVLADGETASYSWKKKGNDTELANTATFDLGSSAAESQAGTYVVTVTVSKAGKASATATKEVTLTVTAAVEEPVITANKATVYPGNSVTLTATCGTDGVTWNWYLCANADGTGAGSSLGTSSSYTIASAGAAGTYYYKAVATGSCGTAERVYTLTVTAASECEKYFWFVYAADATSNGVVNNRDGFFTGAPTGSSNSSTYKFTLDGTEYTATKNTGSGSFSISFTIPEGSTATMGINCKGSSSKPLYLTHSSGTPQKLVSNSSSNASCTVEDITEGTWTLTSAGSWTLAALGVQVCTTSTCTDATPTITAVNNTVCSGTKMRIDAMGYEAGATFKWQKLNTSTSSWDDVAGAILDSLVIASAAAENAGSYRFIATKGCARTSNTVTISVPSAPNFGSTVPASVSVMQTIALSINTVEATDAVKYRWYKSADATWDAGDVEIGTNKELIKAYDSEAIGSPSYHIFCRAQNACGITTSTAIAVNVTAYVEEDCATRGNESDAEFGFVNTSAGQGSYQSTNCWTMNSNSKYLTYTAPEGKYFKTMKVTIASSSASKASYNWSTNGGTTFTEVAINSINTTLTEKTIDVSAHGNVNALQIGRNLDGKGESSGTLYVSKICFEYTDACTATTVTPSTSSVNYEMGGVWSNPTFTLSVAGTLTYSSSNEDIASVDDDGTVTFNGEAGTVTITASYAGGTISATEYCASSGSYTINVSCPGGAPKVVADGSVNMSGCNSSVILNAKTQAGADFADGTYQWFRNGEEIDGETSSSYTATQAGTYTVERTNGTGCTTPSTNSAVVTSETTEPEVERLVPFQYYHVDKTYTAQMKMRHLFAVKNSGKLDGKSFKMYVSRSGGAATDVTSSDALAIWTNADGRVDTVMVDLNKLSGKYSENDELVFTCKAVDCSGNVSDVYKNTITMNVIGATPTLALICSGSSKAGGTRKTGELTVGGDFLTGYNVADLCQQTGNTSFDANTEWGLYTDLKTQYIVTPVNGYAVFNKLNYEPFDILLLTDYPKASKSDAAADVLDDMAALCDYRPMLSFKTHMVAKSPSKWAKKGFTTSPVVTKADGRLNLNIVCYAHPMFNSLKTGDDVYTDVGNTSAPLVYTMLSGTGYESSKGMQGFELAAAENFVTIGLTHYNGTIAKNSPDPGEVEWTPGSEDRMLVTVAERQANPEARFILFSLNCGAQSKLTDKGEEVVLACLNYLLGTAEGTIEPADCSFTFDNGENNEHNAAWYASNCPLCTGTKGDGKWTTAANWGPDYRLLPGEFTSVRIKKPVEVDDTHAHVMEVRLIDEGRIDIPAGKALDVKSTIRRMDGTEIYPTEENDIHISSASTGNGTLIFNNDDGDAKARVDMYSNAQADMENMSAATSTWQYIGTPHSDVASATHNYYDSWLYQYSGSSWEVIPNGGPLVPFRGYCVTHPDAPVVFGMEGTLVATTAQDITIPAGYTVIANSWTAPIDINAITDDDMENISDKTIYFFNTGSDADGNHGTGTAAGTYRATPIHSSSYTGDWQIPSMQGFYVSTATAGTFHLDYERHVRPAGSRTIVGNPMYAPRRSAAESDEPNVLKIFARGSRYQDKLVVLEREDFTRGYDSGWDGEAWGGSNLSPMVYVTGEGREDAVSAIPEFEGTVVAFKAGEDNEYRFEFIYDGDESLYLFDTENNTYTQIMTGNAYYFTTSDKAPHSRFILTRKAPQIATGVEPPSDGEGAKARKLLIEDKMYILLNGMLYDATGKVVK